MKVLDLQCSRQHVFEGWFASEEDFTHQRSTGLLTCPMCNDSTIIKMLSAPRLNLGATRPAEAEKPTSADTPPSTEVISPSVEHELQAAWLKVARRIMTETDDVGLKFAEEARKIHYGEVPERGIRGQATPEQTQALIEEGIAVLPMALPEALKETLQ
jgi:hypothetical protein